MRRPPLPTSGSGMSTPWLRMHWANLSAWSRSSACCSGDNFGATASRYFRHAASARCMACGAMLFLPGPPTRMFPGPPSGPGFGSGMFTPWLRMQRANFSCAASRLACVSADEGVSEPHAATVRAAAQAVSAAVVVVRVMRPSSQRRLRGS